MPENQTAWNSDNQGIKPDQQEGDKGDRADRQAEKTHSKAVDHASRVAEWETETQSQLCPTAGVTTVGTTPSLTQVHWKVGQELSKHCSLSDPTDSTTMQQGGLPCCGEYLRLHPLQLNKYTETKKYGPNERTEQDFRKELSDKEIANLMQSSKHW